MPSPPLSSRCVAEVMGTFVLVFFGCGAVHVAVLHGALPGLWQVAIIWGVAIMLAAFVFGGISGAHINPAITCALAVWGRFPWSEVVPYVISQMTGAIVAATVLYGLFHPFLADKEKQKGVIRGQPGSEITAMCYGEYFPNPGSLGGGEGRYSPEAQAELNLLVSEPVAFSAEVLGTLLLAMVVFALTDPLNVAAPTGRLAPVFIGLTVAVLIVVIAPLTQACFNPARDFGPRLVAYVAGWRDIAIPGRGTGFLTVYILAPVVGAIAGGGVYLRIVQPALKSASEIES